MGVFVVVFVGVGVGVGVFMEERLVRKPSAMCLSLSEGGLNV